MKLYRKVYIKNDADLPKEYGRYVVHLKETDTQRDYPFYCTKVSIRLWNKFVDWYLQPIDITDADIEAWAEDRASNPLIIEMLIMGAKAALNNEIKNIEKWSNIQQ